MSLVQRIIALAETGKAPGFCWLDGGDGSRSFVAAWPEETIEGDDLELLEHVERRWRAQPERIWMGWLTYEAGADAMLGRAPRRRGLPGVVWRRYPGALEIRGEEVCEHGDPRACARLREALKQAPSRSEPLSWPLAPLQARLAPDDYRSRVHRAKAHVVAGETYQVNLSQPFEAVWNAEARQWPLARRVARVHGWLRSSTPATMGALIDAGSAWIASNSPETLIDVRFGQGAEQADLACSWPIKGTAPRGRTPAADAELKAGLERSRKDLAEHVMIVDLVRNDLGRLAIPGTVRAPATPTVMALPTVHHLVSRVCCDLRPGWSLLELVRAVFPGGSITGAPKRRTIEIIDVLESEPRSIYCGAIGVLEPGGLRLSIPIRTGVLDDVGLSLHSGGGIVVDSDPEAEREETVVKTRAFAPGADREA